MPKEQLMLISPIPILLRSDEYIMDGWHRVLKALTMGHKKIPAKVIVNLPKPDMLL